MPSFRCYQQWLCIEQKISIVDGLLVVLQSLYTQPLNLGGLIQILFISGLETLFAIQFGKKNLKMAKRISSYELAQRTLPSTSKKNVLYNACLESFTKNLENGFRSCGLYLLNRTDVL